MSTTKHIHSLMGLMAMLAASSCGTTDSPTGALPSEDTESACEDGADNDGNGDVDCDDASCAPYCDTTGDTGDTGSDTGDTGSDTDDYVPPEQDPWRNREREIADPGVYVSESAISESFGLVANGAAARLIVSGDDFEGVVRAAGDLQQDVERVTGLLPELRADGTVGSGGEAVLIGTLGHSPLIDALVDAELLDVGALEGKWETFVITTVENPTEDLERALVIVGSDQRGTIFGIYDLAVQIGVSPWHFWADVPPKHKNELHVLPGRHTQGEPAVKYRGVFINDEAPALEQWHRQYFGGREFKSAFYEKVFEVLLRLKANYLWPAVWGRAFAEDDPNNHATAKRYGIVMGTSHEAPMMRGIEEWNRHANEGVSDPYGGNGEWSYRTNAEAVEAYWQDGIQRMVDEDFEGIVTIGMRGPGDVALPPEDGIPLVNEFVGAQRRIIEQVTGRHPARTPQAWTLYKEVQEWWDEGLRVPSDVTVIWCDDNWGNLQDLPDPNEPERIGGYGIYYHFDYVGGPRNYKWVDTNLVPNIWEQLHLTYERGVDRVWMVNVGDLKGNELPTQFFMDYAWSPERWPAERLTAWETAYAAQQFGSEHAEAVAAVLHTYAALQSDRKPELLNLQGYSEEGSPFSLTNYREMERVTEQWLELSSEAEALESSLPEAWSDAYYQLVLYPVKASALMYELRLAGFSNLLYAEQGRAAANDQAALAEARFVESQALRERYHSISEGKWDGFQTQTYLGYDNWQQPDSAEDFIHPQLVGVEVPEGALMGVAVDGSEKFWQAAAGADQAGADADDAGVDADAGAGADDAGVGADDAGVGADEAGADADDAAPLPAFSPYQTAPAQYIEVFRRGTEAFEYEIEVEPEVEWFSLSQSEGALDEGLPQERVELRVNDWSAVPEGGTTLTLTVRNRADDTSVRIEAPIEKPATTPEPGTFVESNGYVSIEAAHDLARIIDSDDVYWQLIPNIGRTGSGLTPFPVTAERQTPGTQDGPRLEYDLHLFSSGPLTVWLYLSPRQNTYPTDGLKIAAALDGGDPQIFNITTELDTAAFPLYKHGWQVGVADNVHRVPFDLHVDEPGKHVLQVWMVDPSVVVQKIVVDTGTLRDSYLGPPPSYIMPSD